MTQPATFLYWIPTGQQALDIDQLRKVGIGYAFEEGEQFTFRGCSAGPDGKQGLVVAQGDSKLGYYADQQQWRTLPKNEHGVQVGLWKERRPNPEGLRRKEQIGGVLETLADGGQWLLPTARRVTIEHEAMAITAALPQLLKVGEDGDIVLGGVVAKHKVLWELVERYETRLAEAIEASGEGDGEVSFSFPEMPQLIEAAIGTNYRVSLVEIGELEIYDTSLSHRVTDALRDAATATAWQQKKSEAAAGVTS